MQTLNRPLSLARRLRIRPSIFVFAVILLFAGSSSVLGQGGQQTPVARLISSSAVHAVSRPRRVEETAANSSKLNAAATPTFAEANAVERTAFTKINEARVKNGLTPLAWDPLLCVMARMHSEEMAKRGYFAHETPEGLAPKDRARALGILHFRVLGENIAYNKGYEDPGAFAAERWLLSGAHRANILYIGFQASAIGTYVSADGSVYLTQVFITR
jgi:uncharacterized protein YkwD